MEDKTKTSDFSLDNLRHDLERHLRDTQVTNHNGDLFSTLTANKWIEKAKKEPIPKMLLGELWFEGELCIGFADTNTGKSIFAVQGADSISRGVAMPGFKLEAPKQKVIYFDFELSQKQFEARYSQDYRSHFIFDDNLLRSEINPDSAPPSNVEEYINQAIEKAVIETNAKVLIIDNITYLRSETEKAKDALPLMKGLKQLKKKYKLSILCLAHTPKRDMTKPITRNDLQGSKMLINFCDAAFAIGESHKDKSLRYIKQIKSRNTDIIYDSENVILCEITKPFNFLGFNFLRYADEREHLKSFSEEERGNRTTEALSLKEKGMSNVAIAQKFGVSETAIRKWIKKAEVGKIEPVEPIELGTNGSSSSKKINN